MSVPVAVAPATRGASSTVFGVTCYAGTFDTAVEAVIARVPSQLGGYAVLCNVHVLMEAQDEPDLHAALEAAWLVLPDGAPVAWLQRRLGLQDAERVGGPDLMLAVLDRGRPQGIRHFLLGSTGSTLVRLEERIRARLRGIEIVGTYAPPFGDTREWTDEAVVRIRALQPDIIWLALGAPKQELWMRQYASAVAPAIVMGVGAAFDFHAQTKTRAPRWMREAGLEWAHRLASEPMRLGGRYLSTNTAFLLRVADMTVRQRLSAAAATHDGEGPR